MDSLLKKLLETAKEEEYLEQDIEDLAQLLDAGEVEQAREKVRLIMNKRMNFKLGQASSATVSPRLINVYCDDCKVEHATDEEEYRFRYLQKWVEQNLQVMTACFESRFGKLNPPNVDSNSPEFNMSLMDKVCCRMMEIALVRRSIGGCVSLSEVLSAEGMYADCHHWPQYFGAHKRPEFKNLIAQIKGPKKSEDMSDEDFAVLNDWLFQTRFAIDLRRIETNHKRNIATSKMASEAFKSGQCLGVTRLEILELARDLIFHQADHRLFNPQYTDPSQAFEKIFQAQKLGGQIPQSTGIH